jgi:hypothetical protein
LQRVPEQLAVILLPNNWAATPQMARSTNDDSRDLLIETAHSSKPK